MIFEVEISDFQLSDSMTTGRLKPAKFADFENYVDLGNWHLELVPRTNTKPKFREPVWPDDWGKAAQFREDSSDYSPKGILSGRMPDGSGWIDEDGCIWDTCRIFDA